MKKERKLRRSGLVIMSKLIIMLKGLMFIMVLAILNGTIGNLCAIGVTFFGALGIAKILGIAGFCAEISISMGLIIGLCVGCGVLRGILKYFEQYSNHYIAFRILAVLRNNIFDRLRKLAPAKLEDKQKGNLISMITSDIETLEVFYAHTISPICIAFLSSLTMFLVIGFVSSWYLALVALFGYILVGMILPLIYSKALKSSGVKYRAQFASFNSYFLDSIYGIKEIVLNNNEKQRINEVSNKTDELLKTNTSLKNKSSITFGVTEFVISLVDLGAIIVGLLLLFYELFDLGLMVIGLVAIISSFGPVVAISNLPTNLTQTFASGDRVLNLLKEKPIVEDIKNGKDFEFKKLSIKNLTFKYPNTENVVLNGLNIDIKKGEIIGIAGESGCGKSTLLKLLLRFYKKDNGQILYNDFEIENINTTSLHENVTLVSQDTYLFDDTIENNLRIAKFDATEDEIKEACKKASIHEFINNLPDGYQSKVGQMGDLLSAGEKQRIGLARAFLRKSELILFDEPTSNVDSINEGIILKSLIEQKKNHSIVIVSHRESTIAFVDHLYRFKNGEIRKER